MSGLYLSACPSVSCIPLRDGGFYTQLEQRSVMLGGPERPFLCAVAHSDDTSRRRACLSVRNSMVSHGTLIRPLDSDIGYQIQRRVVFCFFLTAHWKQVSSLWYFFFCYPHHPTAFVMASREEKQFAVMRSRRRSFKPPVNVSGAWRKNK